MPRYLISFDEGWMTHSDQDHHDVADAAHAVVREAQEAGVWVFGGGLFSHEEMSVVAPDGTVGGGSDGKSAWLGGMSIVEVASREDALAWAAKVAASCRCAQEVREFMPDPAVGN